MSRDQHLRAEAAVWLARLKADDRSADDIRACEAWLAASESHREALAEVTAAWEVAGLAGQEWRRARRPAKAGVVTRRSMVMGALAVACGGAAWSLIAPKSYATGVGQIQRFTLDDGSTATLDTRSRIRVSLGLRSRDIELVSGRMALMPERDDARAISVTTRDLRVLSLDGGVEVARYDEDVSVTCLDGALTVRGEGLKPTRVAAGERLRLAAGAPPKADRPSPTMTTAWQGGRLQFDDVPLAEAVEQMNRYSHRPIVITDRATAALRLSGVYQSSAADAFAPSLADLFRLELTETEGQIRLSGAPVLTP